MIRGKYSLAIPGALQAFRFVQMIHGVGHLKVVGAYLLLAEANLGKCRRYLLCAALTCDGSGVSTECWCSTDRGFEGSSFEYVHMMLQHSIVFNGNGRSMICNVL